MLTAGIFQKLHLARFTANGAYLMDETGAEVLLPKRYLTDKMREGDTVEAFVFFDSEDRLVATTDKPFITLGKIAVLEVVAASSMGAFLDWGLPKDLFLPRSNYRGSLFVGDRVAVALEKDRVSGRLVATTKLGAYLSNDNITLQKGDKVDIIVTERTDRGFKVIVEGKHRGMIYDSQIFERIEPGDSLTGYVRQITELGRIDITVQKEGYDGVKDAADRLLNLLESRGGFLDVCDSSSPEKIANTTGMSKKLFKKAVGTLLKERKIEITDNGIKSL